MSARVEISHDLYRWLVQYQVLPNNQKYKPSGNFEIQLRLQQQLQSGFLLSRLLTKIASQKLINLNNALLSSIKNSNTPAARVYNWNILSQGFAKIGVSLSKQQQKQITTGNFSSLVLYLLQVQNKTSQKKLQKQTNSYQEPGLDIKKVHKYQEIDNSETVLELLIILISKCMNLSAKQAVATLAQSSKYLSHMIVKGIKGSFDQIISFVQESIKKMDKIVYISEKDAEKNMQFLLQVFKPTLISRDSQVAKIGCQFFKSLIYESSKYNKKNLIYQILCKEGEGFDFLYMGLKRHPYLNFQIFDFLYPFLQGVLKDFLEVQLKRSINNQLQTVKTIILIIEPLLHDKDAKKQLFQSQLYTIWQKNLDGVATSKLKGKDINTANQQLKYQYVQLMYNLWVGFYSQLQPTQAQQMLMKITEQLKKNTRSQSYTIRIPSLLKMFSILEFLATNKNKLAALLYKKIIFLFVENHNQQQMRQIVLQNLMLTINKFPTIPLQFLLQPMLKQLTSKQGTSYILNMYDFQFIIELCKHPKMQQYYAITFLDYFIKLYTKSVIYSSLIFRVIEAITARFCQSEHIREYCLKFTQTSLNTYGMLVMGKTKGNRANYSINKGQNKQENIINNQKKSLIIQLIKHFISLQHKQLTEQIKNKIATLFIDWYQNRNHYDKGLAALLMQIGDIQDILIQYKQKQIDTIRMQSQQPSSRNQNSSNQFNFHQNQTGRDKKVESKNLLKYQQELYEDERGSPNISDIGLGYKKKKNDALGKYELLGVKNKNVKPDPKVLQDIQKIKQKWKMDHSRAKLQEIQAKKDKIGKINEIQLFQRNLSLGYSKLPELSSDQVLFQFDSVKKKHLKDTLDLINLDNEQQRQLKSFLNIIQRYQKYIKSLFINYASKSAPISENKQLNILSFTQIMRLLKDKCLIAKIPKIAINQIITSINQKRKKERNVLGGVYEQDFPTFILYFTDLIMQQDSQNKKDEPFGLKVEKVILKLLEGENNVKELFDPKIQKIKQELDYNEDYQIPQDFKKTKQTQVQLEYSIKIEQTKINMPFIDCYEIVDQLLYEAIGLHILSPFTNYKQKTTIVRIFKPNIKKSQSQSMDKKLERAGTQQAENNQSLLIKKDILSDSHNSFTKPLKKISKNLMKKKSQSQRNVVNDLPLLEDQMEKDKNKKRQAHAQKLKEQILKMRQQKQKLNAENKQKQKSEQEKQRKKQQLKKQYLQENKKKIKQKKEEEQRKKSEQERIQQQNKVKKKAELKQKEASLLQKQKKLIQVKKQKTVQRAKLQQMKQKKNEHLNKSKSSDKILTEMKASAADQKMKDLLIKNSMDSGQLKTIIDKYRKRFQQLFQIYWNWQKQKMELKNMAQLFKDFQTTKYIPPKDISDIYKSVSKGQLLSIQNFIQCVVKLSYKSVAIQQQVKSEDKVKQLDQENKINPAVFLFLINLLKMDQTNYKQMAIQTKQKNQHT